MKVGQTLHEPWCDCDFCITGFTRMKHPTNRLERLQLNEKKDRRRKREKENEQLHSNEEVAAISTDD